MYKTNWASSKSSTESSDLSRTCEINTVKNGQTSAFSAKAFRLEDYGSEGSCLSLCHYREKD